MKVMNLAIMFDSQLRDLPKTSLLRSKFWRQVYFISANLLPPIKRFKKYLTLCSTDPRFTEAIKDNEYLILFSYHQNIDRHFVWADTTEMKHHDLKTSLQLFLNSSHFADMFPGAFVRVRAGNRVIY